MSPIESLYRTSSKIINLNAVKILVLSFAALSISCSYEVSLNQRTLYAPPNHFMDYSLTDENLKKCVQSSIKEGNITSADKLTSLLCPGYEIRSLEGLQTFTHLRTLGLSNNKIQNIKALSALIELSKLDLSENQITSISPLNELPKLIFLEASNNPLSSCNELSDNNIKEIILPTSCLESHKP